MDEDDYKRQQEELARHVERARQSLRQSIASAITDDEDDDEYKRRREEIARHAESEGAWYYDPESPVNWKRYIIGPVPIWRRILWWFFPPSHGKMRRIMQRRSDKVWKDATGHLSGPRITAKDVVRVVVLSMAGPVIVSALGSIYYGYTHGPYWHIIVWALASTVLFLWWARPNLKSTLSTATPSIIGKSLLVVAIVIVVAVAFVVGDSLVYLFAGSLHLH
jgi:hypothetical protein